MIFPSHLGMNQREGQVAYPRDRLVTSLGNIEATPASLTFMDVACITRPSTTGHFA
ncbi:hypothetical protein B0H10DRAFT_2091250 [Mycena sp. CBHHK59/15]|nr:hypothetical protein B0H10DRAFT_2091250 [Mycena sp. CBHHK59/15]